MCAERENGVRSAICAILGGPVDAEAYIDNGGPAFVDGCGAVDAGVGAINTSDSLRVKLFELVG